MNKREKIGLTEWFEVRRHSRILFLRLSDLDVRLHDIQPGDRLKMKLEEIDRLPRAQEPEVQEEAEAF